MSEPNTESLANVEDDSPEPPQQTAQPQQAAPEPPQEPEEEEAVDVNGTRLVPLSALKQVREELKAVRGQASQAQQLAQQLAETRGQLQGYQQVTQQLQAQRQAPEPKESKVDPNALKFAQRLDLYRQDASGQAVPDTDKAAELLAIIEQVADQKASARMQPLQQQSAQQASARNYQWAIGIKDPSGRQVDQSVITEIWKAFPAEYTANPQVAQTLVYTALGMDRMRQQAQVQPPAGPPVHTEGVGGNPRNRPVMSELERKIAADRGVDEKKWASLTDGFVKGRPNVLEE